VENAIKAKFPSVESSGEPTPTSSGAFEVVLDGTDLVHSKLNGDGHVDSMEKLEKILAAIEAEGRGGRVSE
jgi:selT/selW/selH-like putative selenoprotein